MARERDAMGDKPDDREVEELDKSERNSKNGAKSKGRYEEEESPSSDGSEQSSDDDDGGERKRSSSSRGRRGEKRRRRSSSSSSSRKRRHSSSSSGESESESEAGSSSEDGSDSDGSESESEDDRRRRKRRERRKREEKERRREKERKRKRREKEKKRRDKDDKRRGDKKKKKRREKEKEKGKPGAVTNSWGKYGVIREIDMWNKRPEFTAWLAEVKQVNLESLPNWEEKKMFKEYMEDYNTATFPSKKYYDLDAYHRRQLEKEMKKGIKKVVQKERTVFNDEEQRRLELMQAREKQKEQEVEALKNAMKGGMAQAMKEQAQLREEMAYLYKIGNFEAAAAIQKKLDPDVAM